MQPRGPSPPTPTPSPMPNAHADGAGTRALSCHAWFTRPSISPSHPWTCPLAGACWGSGLRLHGRCWGRRAGTPPRGNCTLRPRGKQASSMYASGGISVFGTVYARTCVHTVYVLSLIIQTCILTLRGFGCQRKQNTGGSAVRRRAEQRCSHNKAPRASLSACSTAAVRLAHFGGSVMASYMDAWAALCYAQRSRARIAYSASCAPSDQQQAVPVIPRTLEATPRSRFIHRLTGRDAWPDR